MIRFGKLAALAAVGTLTFTACGGSTESSTSTTSAAGTTSATAAAAALACPTGKLVGGGSTAQKLAMETLTSDYAAECGNKGTIEYSGTGSGQGIKDFYNKQIDFAGSDSALKTKANADGVIEADKAKSVMIIKRGMSAGFAGIDNPIYYNENTHMLFGDAKKMAEQLVKEIQEL